MTSTGDIQRYREGLFSFIQTCEGDLTPVSSARVVKAREKLRKLTRVQFIDLTIDVYDELERRNAAEASPHTAPRHLQPDAGYHPKRNQARQKLAALPAARFKDLVNDVLFEIDTRSSGGSFTRKELGEAPRTNGFYSDANDTFDNSQLQNKSMQTGNDQAHANNDPLPKTNNKEANNNNKLGLKLNIPTVPVTLPVISDIANNIHKTPLNDAFNSATVLETPSQMKSTTLVPQKSELTWSSDDDEEDDEDADNSNFNPHNALLRSPSKKVKVATNEVLNEHAGPELKFPVDNDDEENEKFNQSVVSKQSLCAPVANADSQAALKEKEVELQKTTEEYIKLELANEDLQLKVDTLTSQIELYKEDLKKYENFDSLEEEYRMLLEKHAAQTEHVQELQKLIDQSKATNSVDDNIKRTLHEFDEGDDDDSEEEENGEFQKQDEREISVLKTYLEKVLEENEQLKAEIANKEIASHDVLLAKYEELKSQHGDLNQEYEDFKLRTGTTVNETSGVLGKDINGLSDSFNTAVNETNNPHKELQSQDVQKSFHKIDNTIDAKFFSTNGKITISKLSDVYVSLNNIYIYLNECNDAIDPHTLFDKVSTYVRFTNELSKQAIIDNDHQSSKLNNTKRILTSAISNVLSTTRHYALYHQILPKIVLHAALADIYLTVCDLISLVKINGQGIPKSQLSNHQIQLSKINTQAESIDSIPTESPVEEACNKGVNISQTPMALKMGLNLNNKSMSLNESQTSFTSPINERQNNDLTSAGVRPLRITQRLTQAHESKSNNELASDVNLDRSANESTLTIPMITSSPTLNKSGMNSPIPLQLSIVFPGKDTSPLKAKSPIDFTPPHPAQATKNSVLDRMRKLNQSVEEQLNFNDPSGKEFLNNQIKIGGDVSKAFDKFGGKRNLDDTSKMMDSSPSTFVKKFSTHEIANALDPHESLNEFDDTFENINFQSKQNGSYSSLKNVSETLSSEDKILKNESSFKMNSKSEDCSEANNNGVDSNFVNEQVTDIPLRVQVPNLKKILNKEKIDSLKTENEGLHDKTNSISLDDLPELDQSFANRDFELTPELNKYKPTTKSLKSSDEPFESGPQSKVPNHDQLAPPIKILNGPRANPDEVTKTEKNEIVSKSYEEFDSNVSQVNDDPASSQIYEELGSQIDILMPNSINQVSQNKLNGVEEKEEDISAYGQTKTHLNGSLEDDHSTNKNSMLSAKSKDPMAEFKDKVDEFKTKMTKSATESDDEFFSPLKENQILNENGKLLNSHLPLNQINQISNFERNSFNDNFEDFNKENVYKPTDQEHTTSKVNESKNLTNSNTFERQRFNEEPDFNADVRVESQPLSHDESNPFVEKREANGVFIDSLGSPIKKSKGLNNLTTPLEADNLATIDGDNSVLNIDEQLKERVSRRLSRRVSLKDSAEPLKSNTSNSFGEDEEDEEDEEDDVDEEEMFDIENFNTLNPDNTLHELLLYLEHQTVEVINAIQTMLGSIKNPKATKGLLREGANCINQVVKAMAEGTSTLMNQSRYAESMGHARYVVEVLEDCVKRMEGLYGEDLSRDEEYAGKNFKQRSAGIAFDVARSTKELVKTVEEASIRDEIAVLDSRLNNSVSRS